MDLRRISRLSLIWINRRVYQLRRIVGVKRTLGEVFIRQGGVIEVIDKIPRGIALGAAAVLCAVSFRVIAGGKKVVAAGFCLGIEVNTEVNSFTLGLYSRVRILVILIGYIVILQRLIDGQVSFDNGVFIFVGGAGIVFILGRLLQLQSVGCRRVQIVRINRTGVGFIRARKDLIGF